MTRLRPWVTIVAVLTLVRPAQAQIPVAEVGPNLVQSTITAAQSTLTAISSAQTAANTILDLTPLDEIAILAGLWEKVQELGDILLQVEGLSNDVNSLRIQLNALFDLDLAPAGSSALQARLAEIRRLRWQCYSYAMRLQTLLKTATRTVEHLFTLVSSISSFLGNKQAAQTLAQINATISKTLTIQAVQAAAFQRAASVDKMEELLTVESLARIQAEIMADWPKR